MAIIAPQLLHSDFLYILLISEMGLTKAELSEILGIPWQLVGTSEVDSSKVPASRLPVLAKLFAILSVQLTGINNRPEKRGPASTLQRQIEQIGLMPRAKQKFISEMLDALIQQQQVS